jgi:hypothetical protein
MVAPLIIGSALLSGVQGLMGFLGSSDESAAAELAGKTQLRANQIDLRSAIAAGRLELQAAGLDAKAARLDVQGVTLATGAAVFDALLSAEIDARNFEANAEALEFNAKVSGHLAKAAQRTARTEGKDFRRQQGSRLSSRRAAQASSGLTLEGSPMMVDQSILAEIELGVARIEHQGDVQFFEHLTEQELLRRTAVNERSSATLARKAGKINVKNIKEAGKISLKGALMGLETAELKRRGAQLGIDTSRSTSSVRALSIRQGSTAAQGAAKSKGISALIGGLNQATSTLSTEVKFG